MAACRFPIATLLAWLWQRWEIEVAHREMKSGLGVGEKQCWNTRSADGSGAVVGLGLCPPAAGRLPHLGLAAAARRPRLAGGRVPNAGRLTTLWRSYRAALWGTAEFRALWMGTGDNGFSSCQNHSFKRTYTLKVPSPFFPIFNSNSLV